MNYVKNTKNTYKKIYISNEAHSKAVKIHWLNRVYFKNLLET